MKAVRGDLSLHQEVGVMLVFVMILFFVALILFGSRQTVSHRKQEIDGRAVRMGQEPFFTE